MVLNQKKRKEIIEALNWRYAVKIFNKEKKVDEEDIHTILESARLSPSSLGLEPWKFFIIKDPIVRAKIFEVSKQPKVTDASHLIVITYRTDIETGVLTDRLERTAKTQNQKIEELDNYKNFLKDTLGKQKELDELEPWIKAQAYIPLGIMIQTASLLGVDNGPMEGFKADKVDEILGLKEKNLKSVTMLALGYRGEDPASIKPKIRREFDEVVEVI